MRHPSLLWHWCNLCLQMSNSATRQPTKLQHWQNWHSPRSDVAMRRQCKQQCLRRALSPTSAAIMRQLHELQSWQNWCLQRSNVATRRPCGRKHWPTMHASNVAESWPNALRRRQSRRRLRSKLWYWQIQHCPSRLWRRISGTRRKPPKNSAIQMTSALWRRYCRPTPLMRQSGAFG